MNSKKVEGNVILIDKSPKKCKFLNDLSNKLGLTLKIQNVRLEDYKLSKISPIVSRAFKKVIATIEIDRKSFVKEKSEDPGGGRKINKKK